MLHGREHNRISASWAFLGIVALVLIGVVEHNLLATIFFGLLFGAIGLAVMAVEWRTDLSAQKLLTLFWIVYGSRIAVVALLHYGLSFTPHAPWWDYGAEGGDEMGFWTNSETIMQAWQEGWSKIFQTNEVLDLFINYIGWLHIVGFVRYAGDVLDGASTFHVKLFLCMAGTLCVAYTYGFARIVLDERRARLAALLAFALPDYWFFSATIMRDVLVSAANIAFFYHVAFIMHRRFSWPHLVMTFVINFYFIRYLRADMAILNAIILTVGLVWMVFAQRHDLLVRFGLAVAMLSIGIVAVLSIGRIDSALNSVSSGRYNETAAVGERVMGMRAQSLEDASDGSFGAKILNTSVWIRWPAVSALVLLEPIPPWAGMVGVTQGFVFKAIVVTICALGWYGFLVFFPAGIVSCVKMRSARARSLLLVTVVYILAFGLAVGATPRWRLTAMPFLLTIIAGGIYERELHRGLIWGSIATIGLGLIAYYMLKYL